MQTSEPTPRAPHITNKPADSDGPEDRPSGVYSATDNSLARAPPPRPGVDLPQTLHGVPDANTVPPTGVTATGPPAPAV